MKIFVYENYEKMSRAAAQFLAAQLMEKPCSHIGLTAGKTPMGLFQELIRQVLPVFQLRAGLHPSQQY